MKTSFHITTPNPSMKTNYAIHIYERRRTWKTYFHVGASVSRCHDYINHSPTHRTSKYEMNTVTVTVSVSSVPEWCTRRDRRLHSSVYFRRHHRINSRRLSRVDNSRMVESRVVSRSNVVVNSEKMLYTTVTTWFHIRLPLTCTYQIVTKRRKYKKSVLLTCRFYLCRSSFRYHKSSIEGFVWPPNIR